MLRDQQRRPRHNVVVEPNAHRHEAEVDPRLRKWADFEVRRVGERRAQVEDRVLQRSVSV